MNERGDTWRREQSDCTDTMEINLRGSMEDTNDVSISLLYSRSLITSYCIAAFIISLSKLSFQLRGPKDEVGNTKKSKHWLKVFFYSPKNEYHNRPSHNTNFFSARVWVCPSPVAYNLIQEKMNFHQVRCDSINPAPRTFLCQLVWCVWRDVCEQGFQFAVISDSPSLIPTEGRVVGRRELLQLHTRKADYLSTGGNTQAGFTIFAGSGRLVGSSSLEPTELRIRTWCQD